MSRIVWLASYPKSGNTWLRAFLANLLAGGEEPFDINRLSDFTLSDMRAGYFEEVAQRPIDGMTPQEINALRPRVHRFLAERESLPLVKTHHAIGVIDGVPTITTEVTRSAIYIVRNPLDLVVSLSHHMNLGLDDAIDLINSDDAYLGTHGRMVFQFLGSWSFHVKSWTQAPGLRRHVVRYEDMLEAPLPAFAAIAAFMELEAGEEAVARAVRFSSFDELSGQETAQGFREQSQVAGAFFRSGRQEVWRERLNAAQVRRIVDRNRETMAEFGYIPQPD